MSEEQQNFQSKILEFFNNNFNLIIIAIFIFGLILRLKYLTINQAVWFDEADYLSAAKNWAFNNVSYQLPFVRPILLPLIWTLFYKIGLGELTFRIIILFFSLTGLVLTYLIGKLLFNKYVALIATIITSFHYMNLFYTARLLTDIPSLTLWLLTIYFFWKGYVEKKGNYVYLMGLTFILSILMRFPAGILGGVLLLFLLLTEGFKFLKDKKLWVSIGIFFIVLLPYAIWYYKNYNKIPILGASAFYTGGIVLKESLNFMPTILMSPIHIFIIILLIGLGIILFDLILGYDLLRRDENLKKQLFIFLWVILTFSYFAFYSGYVEDRYFFYIFPAFFMIIGWVLLKINDLLKKYQKFLGIFIIILLLCFTGYKQLTQADNLIELKSTSYVQFKLAGEWIKENSNKYDTIVASGEPFFIYYAERKSYGYPDEGEFLDFIKNNNIKYMVLTATESSPEWTYSWPEKNKDKVKPVQAYYFDGEKTKLAILIYQFQAYEKEKNLSKEL